jgi:hypothetical protein
LAEHVGQFFAILSSVLTNKQSTFGLICSQGTPPVWSGKWSELERVSTTAS